MSLRKLKNKPFYKLLAFVLVLNFILHAVNMNIQAVKSAEFKKYESEISVLKDDVSNLNYKVSSGSSLSSIEQKARNLGFIEVSSNIKVISTTYALNISNEN